MQRQKRRSNQPPRINVGGEPFVRHISEEELKRRKERTDRIVEEGLNAGSEVATFLSVTTIREMGKFADHIIDLMERPENRKQAIGSMLDEMSEHISKATPESVITALRTTYYHRGQYKSSWVRLLKSAREDFAKREDVDVDSLLTGLHA